MDLAVPKKPGPRLNQKHLLTLSSYLTLLHLCVNNFPLRLRYDPHAAGGLGGQGVLPTNPLGETADDELIALCQKRGLRDERPFRELWRRHYLSVWRTCYRFFPHEDDAEDLSQEVFLKAFHALRSFEGRSTFKTWITRIALNTCQNELRRRKSRAEQYADQIEGEEEDRFATNSPSVESQVATNLLMEQLTAAIQQLDPEEWQVIFLKDVEGRGYREIASDLNIGMSAAKMRVQRTRLKLMRLMQGNVGAEVLLNQKVTT